jgi:hypothetical protein
MDPYFRNHRSISKNVKRKQTYNMVDSHIQNSCFNKKISSALHKYDQDI